MAPDELVEGRAVRGVAERVPDLRTHLALVADLEAVGVLPSGALGIGDRLDGLVSDGVDCRLGVGVALGVAALPGHDLDDRVDDHTVDRDAARSVHGLVVAGEGVRTAGAGGDAFVDVGRQQHEPEVAQAALVLRRDRVDLGLDLFVGQAVRRAAGRRAAAGCRIGVEVVGRVARRVVGDRVTPRHSGGGARLLPVLAQGREDVARRAARAGGIGQELLNQCRSRR